MGVRFNSKKTSSLFVAATLVSGAIAYANGATSGGEEPKAMALSVDQAPAPSVVASSTTTTVVKRTVQKAAPTTTTTTTTTTTMAPKPEPADQSKPQNSAAVIVEEVKPEVTTTTTAAPVDHGECAQWRDLALEIGWPAEEWDRLNHVIWRESRCQPDVHNKLDPASGSRGLMQINGFWCRKNRYTDHGYLQDNGVLQTCEDLFNPRVNLTAGLVIWKYGEDKNGCGWRPWSTRSSRWC